jgi:fructokinase
MKTQRYTGSLIYCLENTTMSKPVTLSLGEVLWDVLPDGKALGGSPSNAAWQASQLGAESHIVSAIGDDDLGREIIDTLKGKNLDVATISVLPGVPTSTVDAVLDAAGNASYTIHENVAWDKLPATPAVLALAKNARGINFGSLAQRHAAARATHHAILDSAGPDTVRVFDCNLRPPFIDREILHQGMLRANVVKMNHDELPVLAGLFGWAKKNEDSMADLMRAYPGVRHLVITHGDKGAWWRTDSQLLFKEAPKPERMQDTIGAGDSVTAVCMMGLIKGLQVPDILGAAMRIATFVCSQRGGMPVLPSALTGIFLD